jgi:hypothetical protein
VSTTNVTEVKNGTVKHGISNLLWSDEGHTLTWLRDYNLYITVDEKEYQITYDGSEQVWNGIQDSSETGKTTSFSPSGNSLTFIKDNYTLVHEYPVPKYVIDNPGLYPKVVNYKL